VAFGAVLAQSVWEKFSAPSDKRPGCDGKTDVTISSK